MNIGTLENLLNYINIYQKFIENVKSENREKNKGVYYEKHHIKPMFIYKENRTRIRRKNSCDGDPNNINNIVLLKFREHVFAHILLYKIYENTSYSHAALNSINLMLGYVSSGRITDMMKRRQYYDKIKEDYSKKLSDVVRGTVVVKDAETGEMVGRVSKQHPKYISGEYVFYQKGMKRSESFKQKQSKKGSENSNHSGYSDDDLINSYVECSIVAGFPVSKELWFKWADKNGKPFLKSIKSFRFDGKESFLFLYKKGEDATGIEYDPYMSRNNSKKHLIELFIKNRIDFQIQNTTNNTG